MRLLSLSLLLATVSAVPLAAQTPSPTSSGAVRQADNTICMEPGHPMYDVATYTGTYDTMRACISNGGRRDGPRDTLLLPGSVASTSTDPMRTQDSIASSPIDTNGNPIANTSQDRTGNPTDFQGIPSFGEPVASQTLETALAPAPPKPPKGIELPDTPSYSHNPGIFRAPQDYVGRSPDDFLP